MNSGVVFFDLGDTLGEPMLSPPPHHIAGFNVFPFVPDLLRQLRDEGHRLGIISNTGNDTGGQVDAVLAAVGILDLFEPRLRIYSKDVGLRKDSPDIFRLAAEHADLAATPGKCLFVGEDVTERSFASAAGFLVCPHPLLVQEVLAGHALQYVRITVPPEGASANWRPTLLALPFVPLQLTGPGGTVVYAISSERALPELANLRFRIDLLGKPGLPLETDLFILRDDAAAESGFLSSRGEAAKLFTVEGGKLVVASGPEGLVVALPPARSLSELHFSQTRHGHTLKLLPDPALLEVVQAVPAGFVRSLFTSAVPALPDEVVQELERITGPALRDRIERYSGTKPLGSDERRIVSRHVAHPGNPRAVAALATEFEKLGNGRLTVSLHQFTHRGRALHNIEAELVGESEKEFVLVTAHLDSTAAKSLPYNEAVDQAPGADDDASGIAAVLTLAERMLALTAGARLARTIRFVLFNAEEEGLVGSRAYARLQHALEAKIIGVFQLDMIGFNRSARNFWELHAGFAPSRAVEEQSEILAELVRTLAPRVSPNLSRAQVYPKDEQDELDPADGRSDHTSFQTYGRPAICISENLFAGPGDTPADENEYYHDPDDVSDHIDMDYAADITRAVGAAVETVASGRSDAAFATVSLSRSSGIVHSALEPDEIDVAVVGGGISGVYTAWQLREFGHLSPILAELAERRPDRRLRVVLFEQSLRIGGRLYSETLPGAPLDKPVELGGMRFLNSHELVCKLTRRFCLGSRELPVADPEERHMFYLRGQHFTGADWNRPGFVPPYRLDRNERARSPGQLLIEVALRHRASVAADPERYRNIGFWNLLLDELSEEAYLLVREAGGYETIVSNWSAADAIPFLLADFAHDATYFALHRGFQALPLDIERRFSKEFGGDTRMGHRLHWVDRRGEEGLQLVFDVDPQGHFPSPRRIQRPYTCHARHAVLALPRRAIELLHPDSFMFDSVARSDTARSFAHDLQAVLPQPGFKIFAAYRRPWWREKRGIVAGRSVTDLPVRQCYYWHTADEPPENKDYATGSILMASYNDGSSVEYWAGLARHPVRYQPPTMAALPGVPVFDVTHTSGTAAALVRELQDQVRELHGLADIDVIMPYAVVSQDWTQDPFGGGWHFWKIGERSSQVMHRMRRPFPDAPLYVCGEAWSSQQGWVEGALETADVVLREHLGLPPLGPESASQEPARGLASSRGN